MTTKVTITVSACSQHDVTVKGIFPSLQGGYRDTANLKPGESREFFVHSGNALVIDEGSPAEPAAS